jgi:hypothetical protein
VPFDELVVTEGDAGTPTMIARPHSATALAFELIGRGVAAGLGWRHVGVTDAEAHA